MNSAEDHTYDPSVLNKQQNLSNPQMQISSQQPAQMSATCSRQLKVIAFFLLIDSLISFAAWRFFVSIFDNTYGVWSAGYGTFAAGLTFGIFGPLMFLSVIVGITFAYQSLAFRKKTNLDTEIKYYGFVRKLHSINIILGLVPAILFLGSITLWIFAS